MAKITRATQELFAYNGGVATDNCAQFGSLKNSTPNYTLDPATIQALVAWENGWKGAVVSNNAPALQDLNAVQYLFSRQIAYGLQAGVAEWDSGTTYYTGSLVNDGTGQLYRSLVDDNVATAVSEPASWAPIAIRGVTTSTAGSETLDCQLAETFKKTGSASATSIGLNNMQEGQTVTVLITTVTSQGIITWKRGTFGAGVEDVKWASGLPPTPTVTTGRADRYVFQMIGGTIYGSADMNCY